MKDQQDLQEAHLREFHPTIYIDSGKKGTMQMRIFLLTPLYQTNKLLESELYHWLSLRHPSHFDFVILLMLLNNLQKLRAREEKECRFFRESDQK